MLAPVFKDMGENGARAAQVISALAGNLDMLKWEQEEAAKAFAEATSVTKEYNVQNTTVQAGLDKARKRVKEMAIELGEKLQPVMKHVLSSTTIMLKVLSTIVDFVIKYKAVLLTLTVAVVGYYSAVKLQYLWSLRLVAAQKLKAASMAVEEALMAASILKHKVLRGEITATAAAQTYFNKVLKMNPMGAAIAAMTILIGLYVKFAKTSNDAALAQKRLQEIEEEARLYGHNVKILKNYTEQLKNSARIKAALDKLPEAEKERDKFFNEAPKNIQNAYVNESVFHMKETDAMREASVSPSGYRAWKAKLHKLDAAVTQYNSIVDTMTAANQKLADEAAALGDGGSGGDGNFTPTVTDTKKEERFKMEKGSTSGVFWR